MTGTSAQMIALIAYGNDYLKNETIPADFDAANSTCQICCEINFRKPGEQEEDIANTPTDWFQYLKDEGCQHLRLYFKDSKDQSFTKDYQPAKLASGGGAWLIEAVYDGYSNYWAAQWEIAGYDTPDKRIWIVNYDLCNEKEQTCNWQIDNQAVKDKLGQTLKGLADFSHRQKFSHWGEFFDKAKAVLDSDLPEENYTHGDLVPLDNYSLTGRQILFGACSAWFSGGMGSWDDLQFETEEDHETYDRLSEQLYANRIEAVIAAVNSY